jgi:hypothetical protein
MAKPAAGTVPSDKLQLYEKLVATNPRVKCKGVRDGSLYFAERSYVQLYVVRNPRGCERTS